jgi:DNA helicase HerA-like ATPase
MNAVVAGVAARCYEARVTEALARLPWLLVDEAHAFFDGIAASALRRLLTRGRKPGASLVAATQRPSALPPVALSQADVLVVHRLTSRADREALADARPSYMTRSIDDRMPTAVGEALVIDDATETVHTIQVRERQTPHDGDSPRASTMGDARAE